MDWSPNSVDPQIFHITHEGNLPSIVGMGGLWSDAQRIRQGIPTTNIGHLHIKERRLRRPVTTAGAGFLGDYVPFHFCPRSVMLYAVTRGHDGYPGGGEPVVHLVSSVSRARAIGRPWCFTDRHAELGYASYYERVEDLDQVSWSVMPVEQWGGDDDLKQRRAAEFLVHDFFEWTAVLEVAVRSEEAQERVRKILQGAGHVPPVTVRRQWYY